MKSANAMRSRPIRPRLTGATSTIAPRGTPNGTADSTASAKASLSLTTVRSAAARASPPGIGVGPVSTRTAACARVVAARAPSNAVRTAVPDLNTGVSPHSAPRRVLEQVRMRRAHRQQLAALLEFHFEGPAEGAVDGINGTHVYHHATVDLPEHVRIQSLLHLPQRGVHEKRAMARGSETQ